MEKKLIFKGWVQVLLGVVMLSNIVFITAECSNTGLFIIKTIICSGVITLCYVGFKNHTRIFED